MNRRGWTMMELIAALAILGIISLTVARTQQRMLSSATHTQNAQIMEADAASLLTRLALKIKNAGDGLQGEQSTSNGKTIIALPDNALSNFSPELIFLSKDQGAAGVLDNQDLWTRFSTVTIASGAEALLEETYQSDNWLTIKSGVAPVVGTATYPLSNGAKFHALAFTLYDSNQPPLIANQDPQSTSAVRIAMTLKKGESATRAASNEVQGNLISRERTVVLEGLLYGPR